MYGRIWVTAEALRTENRPHSANYDGFGNLTIQQVTKGTDYNINLGYDPATNRINSAGYGYDNNGNLTAMPHLSMAYDSLGYLLQSTHSLGKPPPEEEREENKHGRTG